jgi:two-component system, chemotaxis family, chemotaxis protein CheY
LPSVLIADDAAFMRMMLRNILTDAGYEVTGEAEDGAEAVSRYLELRPDLTTMDITMPGMNGLDALKAIRAEDPEARVIMCSAMGQK